tara:strand:+ start:19338 stop:20996 length:1659 start_codon:yes stop_codon:yes gene_type:complete
MNITSEMLNYQYPAPKLIKLRGVWVVKVSIPAHMRHLFGNGSGTTRDRRKSTKTKDYILAKSREHSLAQVIYNEFDQKLHLKLLENEELTNDFAMKAITRLAKSFKHPNIPELVPTTQYDLLESFKTSCDVYADMVVREDVEKLRELSTSSLELETFLKELGKFWSQSPFSSAQKGDAGRYQSEIVYNFWYDLLISGSRKQGISEPTIKPFKGSKYTSVLYGDQIVPHIPTFNKLWEEGLQQTPLPIDRPRQITPKGVLSVTSVMSGYLCDMQMKQKNVGTRRKLERWIEQFVSVMGDLKLTEIRPKHGYDYIRAILKDNPTRSNGTLKDYAWGVQNFLKYCLENGWIDTNPFTGLDLSKYGEPAEETYPFSREDLNNIFAYHWEPQERLYLSILATTGMRPSEAVNLTWERFNDTEYSGVRFFSLLNTGEERVQVKNQSSKRDVPIHPELWLPQSGVGRLFDYKVNDEGLSSTDVSHKINPIIGKLIPHPNKSIRSFRRTFKTLLRDLSVGEEVHDAITGHTIPSASRKNYGGMGMQVKFDAISKLDISFL